MLCLKDANFTDYVALNPRERGKFEDGASHVDLKLRSPIDGVELDATIRIQKADVYKSIGTPNKTGTYLSTSKVF